MAGEKTADQRAVLAGDSHFERLCLRTMRRQSQPSAVAAELRPPAFKDELEQLPARCRFPKPCGPVPAVGRQEAAIRVKTQARDLLRVPYKGRYFACGGHVPDLNARVGTGNCETLAVRMPGDS